jgi:hypothetical protein
LFPYFIFLGSLSLFRVLVVVACSFHLGQDGKEGTLVIPIFSLSLSLCEDDEDDGKGAEGGVGLWIFGGWIWILTTYMDGWMDGWMGWE